VPATATGALVQFPVAYDAKTEQNKINLLTTLATKSHITKVTR